MNMSGRKTLAIMLAASFASTIGGLPFNTLPILLGSMSTAWASASSRSVCWAQSVLPVTCWAP